MNNGSAWTDEDSGPLTGTIAQSARRKISMGTLALGFRCGVQQHQVRGNAGASAELETWQSEWILIKGPRQVHALVQILDAHTLAAERAGLESKVSPHWLRHAHATHALERGAPIHLVQATLGHAPVATTGRYLHAHPSDSSARFTSG
jgi:hypothetical protein